MVLIVHFNDGTESHGSSRPPFYLQKEIAFFEPMYKHNLQAQLFPDEIVLSGNKGNDSK